MRPLAGAEEVADGGEVGSLEPAEEDRGPPRLVGPSDDGRGFEVGVNLGLDRPEHPERIQFEEGVGERAVSHPESVLA
jgi:hypothetical protein